jgi:hypothetical protein
MKVSRNSGVEEIVPVLFFCQIALFEAKEACCLQFLSVACFGSWVTGLSARLVAVIASQRQSNPVRSCGFWIAASLRSSQ